MASSRNAVSVQINDHAGFITFELRGVVYSTELLKVTEEIYNTLDAPLRYNRLYDLRAFVNVFLYEDFVALSEQWQRLVGRGAPIRWAILTNDPVRLARTRAFAPLFPEIAVQSFDALASAIDWLTRPN